MGSRWEKGDQFLEGGSGLLEIALMYFIWQFLFDLYTIHMQTERCCIACYCSLIFWAYIKNHVYKNYQRNWIKFINYFQGFHKMGTLKNISEKIAVFPRKTQKVGFDSINLEVVSRELYQKRTPPRFHQGEFRGFSQSRHNQQL